MANNNFFQNWVREKKRSLYVNLSSILPWEGSHYVGMEYLENCGSSHVSTILLLRIQYGGQKRFLIRKSHFVINITTFYFRTLETVLNEPWKEKAEIYFENVLKMHPKKKKKKKQYFLTNSKFWISPESVSKLLKYGESSTKNSNYFGKQEAVME